MSILSSCIEYFIQLHYEDAHAQRGKGAALKALKRHRQALETYNFAIRLDYNNPLIFIEQGEVFEALANRSLFWYENALNAYNHAITLNPTLASAYQHKAKVLDVLKRTEEAEGAFERAKQLDTGNEEAKGDQKYLFIEMKYYDEIYRAQDDSDR